MKFPPKITLSALVTLAYCIFILPINEHIAFTIPTDNKTLLLSHVLKLAFGIALFFMVYFVINFLTKLKQHDQDYLRWLKYTALYFGIMSIVLLLVYPGNWLWDEFLIFRHVQVYSPYSWQHFFTNIYYTFSLYLIPTAVAVAWLQLAFISFVIGYIITKARLLFTNKRLPLLLFIPFLLLPVIYYNLYPLRLTIYSYLEILLLFKLVILHFRPDTIRNRYVSFIASALIITLLCFWRSEGIFYILLLPYIAFKLRLFHGSSRKRAKPYIVSASALLILILGYTITSSTSSPSYQLSATLNPLSTMLQHPLQGSELPRSLESIDKVVDLKFLKDNPDNFEVPVLWYDNTIRPNYKQYISEYNRAALDIISHNPDLWLENRIRLLLATNALDKPIPHVGEGGLRIFDTREDRKAVVEYFATTNHLSRPINPELKENVTRLFLGIDSNNKNTPLAPAIWNFLPTILLVFALTVYSLVRKSYFWTLLCTLVLARFCLLFITAPASYFMYYLPVYMSGNFILALFAAYWASTHPHMISNLKRRLKVY